MREFLSVGRTHTSSECKVRLSGQRARFAFERARKRFLSRFGFYVMVFLLNRIDEELW